MNVLFATWELFWFNARNGWLFYLYHPHWLDDNERHERYWPCSDEPQFWPGMIMDMEGFGHET